MYKIKIYEPTKNAKLSTVAVELKLTFEGEISDHEALEQNIVDALKYQVETLGLVPEENEALTVEIAAKTEWYDPNDAIKMIWAVEDVLAVRSDLTIEEARKVLEYAKDLHNAEIGINFDVLREHADLLFPNPDYDEEDYKED